MKRRNNFYPFKKKKIGENRKYNSLKFYKGNPNDCVFGEKMATSNFAFLNSNWQPQKLWPNGKFKASTFFSK